MAFLTSEGYNWTMIPPRHKLMIEH